MIATPPKQSEMFLEWAQSEHLLHAIAYLESFVQSHARERDANIESGDFHKSTLTQGKILGLRIAIDRLRACRIAG